jgi:hypothetical protein
MTWYSKMMWLMTWFPSGIPSSPCLAPSLALVRHPILPVGHLVRLLVGHPSSTPSGPLSGTRRAPHPVPRQAFCSVLCSSSPPPFALLSDILIFSHRFCHPLSRPPLDQSRPAPPSGTMIWSCRFGKRSSCPPLDLPRPALPSSTSLGTLVSSRRSGRPSISELLDRCPFGPLTSTLP